MTPIKRITENADWKRLYDLKDLIMHKISYYKCIVTEIGVYVEGPDKIYTDEYLSKKLGVEIDVKSFHRFTSGGCGFIVSYTTRSPEESKEAHEIERRSEEKWGWLRNA